MPQTVPTKDVLAGISSCQKILDHEIYPTLKHPQGYGHQTPHKTLATWALVRERLDALSYQWSHALKKMNPSNKRVSLDSGEMVVSLQATLRRAAVQQGLLDDTTEDNRDDAVEYCRCRDFRFFRKEQYPELWKIAPELQAYELLCQLHEYSLGRGWASGKDSPEVLSAGEIEERKKIWAEHLRIVKRVIEAKWTMIQVNPFLG